MTELSPTARALLDAARDGLAPNADALRRVRGKVDAAVVVGGTSLAAKLALVVVAGAVAAGAIATRSREPAVSPELTFGSATSIEPRVVREAPPPPEIEMEATPARAVVVKPEVVMKPKSIDLAREVELVDAAMAALRRGDATAALASVRIHREETINRGQLAEDASAIEIEALSTLRDARCAAKLDAFDTRWPSSAQRSRLACK